MNIVKIDEATRSVVDGIIEDEWGGPMIVTKGRLIDTRENPGFVSVDDQGDVNGLITYQVDGDECEITVLSVFQESQGIGSALIERVVEVAQAAGCARVFLITTNDNTHAIRFYQRRGFELCAVHLNALEASRKLKPQIPLTGFGGIPLKHEFEFEKRW